MKTVIYTISVIIYFLFSSLQNAFPQQTPPEIEWDKTFGGRDYDVAESIVSTPDGGYAVAGFTYSIEATGKNLNFASLLHEMKEAGLKMETYEDEEAYYVLLIMVIQPNEEEGDAK